MQRALHSQLGRSVACDLLPPPANTRSMPSPILRRWAALFPRRPLGAPRQPLCGSWARSACLMLWLVRGAGLPDDARRLQLWPVHPPAIPCLRSVRTTVYM